MYIVTIQNGNQRTEINNEIERLSSGKVVEGINTIDSFSFSILPSNTGFERLHDRKTLVSVLNTQRKRYEFYGRILKAAPQMDESGKCFKNVICESFLGFFHDSVQEYVVERNWKTLELLTHIIDVHNKQVEPYKRFKIGTVDVKDPNDNIYIGIQRKDTWDTIQDKLIKKLGGELRFRVVDGELVLDYLTFAGTKRATQMALSKNMKSITRDDDPSAYISRLIPLGKKIENEEGKETEDRVGIESVNNGLAYIESPEALEKFGIRYAYEIFDDIESPSILLQRGIDFLAANNKVKIRYTINALDLSLLGLKIDDFQVGDIHPIINPLLKINDEGRIIKKNVDILNPVKSTFEIGDNFKTLSELQNEHRHDLEDVKEHIGKIESDFKTNEEIRDELRLHESLIEQTVDHILLMCEETYTSKGETDELRQQMSSQLELLSNEIVAKFKTTTEQIKEVDGVTSSKFEELYKYISMNADGISIGSSSSMIKLQVDNEKGIIFSKNGVPFGTWDGENFYTGNIVVRVNERAQFGSFAFLPREDESLMFVKVGDVSG